jgi:hypothetical protein
MVTEKKLWIIKMHRIQNCTVVAWFIFPILSPLSVKMCHLLPIQKFSFFKCIHFYLDFAVPFTVGEAFFHKTKGRKILRW